MWRTRAGWRNFFARDPRVAWVDYAGFPENQYHAMAQKYLGGRPPSLLTFGLVGGLEAGKAFYDGLKLIKRVVNIGDARRSVLPPSLDDPSADDAGGAAPRRFRARDHPAQRRHRARRGHPRRSRSGACRPRLREPIPAQRRSESDDDASEKPSAATAPRRRRGARKRRICASRSSTTCRTPRWRPPSANSPASLQPPAAN